MLLQGQWPHGLPLLIAWLKDKANITAVSKLPDDMASRLPLVMVSPAPGGGQGDGYTRTRSLDIDVFAADWKSQDRSRRLPPVGGRQPIRLCRYVFDHGILSNGLRACRERASLHGDGQSQHASENKSQIVKIKEE